ncbi:phage portal protein [Schaalia hyovaginalis]|uniref:phage portal protein n=1 Tax=Schaalia hyovaginalis TaxID=29316 RepID=UPI0026F2DADA|nr:phage portal protein [Schaalia hyovaginalis]MCI6557333.1 phage portal protein [Schaalia hyovaginalis]MDY3094208.1 phage portal protein [Schaalia hyovaginalis]MDY3664721.1 phage portal protein [Schaalia hyovaginalis]
MANLFGRILGFSSKEIASPLADREQLEAATWSHLLDLDEAQTIPTRREAMSNAAAARGRNIIAGSIGRLSLIAMKDAAPMADQPRIIAQPEAGRPRSQTITWSVDALIWYGHAWWAVTDRDAGGRPSRVQWVPEWCAELDEAGNLRTAFGRPVAPSNVIRIDGPHEGLLNFAGERIRAARRLDRAALLASLNPVPQLELHQTQGTPLTHEEATAFVAAYVAQRTKSGVSYTNQTIETKTHGATSEALLIDGRKAAALDIARAMGLPAWAVDAPAEGSSMTYTNVPSRARELIDYTLAPYMEAITARLSLDDILPRGQWCRFDTDPLLSDDFAGRMASYKTALETGVYTLDELRAMEHGTPKEQTNG